MGFVQRPVPTLFYDADCGFCTRCAVWLSARAGQLAVVPLQSSLPPAADAVRAQREVPLACPDGQILWGAEAIGAALAAGAPPWSWAGRFMLAPGIRPVADQCYRWVASHRHRLPGGTSRCALPPRN